MADQPTTTTTAGGGAWPEPWPDIDTTLAEVASSLDSANLSSATDGTLTQLTARYDAAVSAFNDLALLADALRTAIAEEVGRPQ